jgi:hypothetical protein
MFATFGVAVLDVWLREQLRRGEQLAAQCGARYGYAGAWVEDRSSGQVLLQQGVNQWLNVHPIDTALTALGNDERAINCSRYVHRGEVKICCLVYDKTTPYKATACNQLLSQVTGLRVGDKDAAQRADEILDCFTYGPAIALGR